VPPHAFEIESPPRLVPGHDAVGEGQVVAGEDFGVVAEVVVGVAEAVPRVGLLMVAAAWSTVATEDERSG
jgi:hypothetical protein